MAFINKIVGPDEKLIGIARLHWIYGVKGLAWLGGLILLGGGIDTLLTWYINVGLAPIGNAAFWVCTMVGVVLFSIYFIAMMTSEVGLTTERFIYKRGWMMVDVREIDLEEVKSESVDNGVMGRLFNYGYLQLDARFIEDIGLPAIADPYRFIKAMNEARTNIKKDSMRVVIDQHSGNADNVARGMRHMQKKKPEELDYHGDVDADDVHDLNDERYEVPMDTPELEMRQSNKNRKKKGKPSRPDAPQPAPPNFKNMKNPEEEALKEKQKESEKPQKRKLFVHEEALHDKVINDFEAAEEKRQKA